jgi:hypothetical protein
MRGFTLSCILTTLFIFSSSWLYGQIHNYEIRVANHIVGNVNARSKQTGTVKNISIQSDVDIKLLAKFHLDITCDFDNNLMTRSRVIKTSARNNGENKAITTLREGKSYSITQNGEKTMLSNTDILHSVSELYFIEPRQITRIYSETLGAIVPLTALGNGLYELSLPDGKKNVYKYEKGVLVQVEVNQTFGKAYIIRV